MLHSLTRTYWNIFHLISGHTKESITFSEALFELRKTKAKLSAEHNLNNMCHRDIERLNDKYEPYLEDDYKKGNWFMDRPVGDNNPDDFMPAQPKKSRVRLDQPIVKQMGDILFTICGHRPDEDELAAKSVWWIDGRDVIVVTEFCYDDGEKIVFSISPSGLGPKATGPWVETMRGETGG